MATRALANLSHEGTKPIAANALHLHVPIPLFGQQQGEIVRFKVDGGFQIAQGVPVLQMAWLLMVKHTTCKEKKAV